MVKSEWGVIAMARVSPLPAGNLSRQKDLPHEPVEVRVKSFPAAHVTSSIVHQREPRNSIGSGVISRLQEPSLMNHKLTSVCPASSPTVMVTVTKTGVELQKKRPRFRAPHFS